MSTSDQTQGRKAVGRNSEATAGLRLLFGSVVLSLMISSLMSHSRERLSPTIKLTL